VHNPFIKEDPRKANEQWSKAWLKDEAKNKKLVDAIVKGYGQAVYDFVSDPDSKVYLYDFMQIL
jgi:hypothetical protein